MTDQTAIVAEIRPGMKPPLEQRLQDVFTGPAAASQLARLAATPAMFRQCLR